MKRLWLLCALLAGCAAAPPTPLPALAPPPWPVLPTVSAAEAAPIPAEVWERLVTRDRLLRNALRECHAILEATTP